MTDPTLGAPTTETPHRDLAIERARDRAARELRQAMLAARNDVLPLIAGTTPGTLDRTLDRLFHLRARPDLEPLAGWIATAAARLERAGR